MKNGQIQENFMKQISYYCIPLHLIHTTSCKMTNKFFRGGAGPGGFANPRRLESCGSAQAGTSGEGKTDMDSASEMNRPSEERAVTPPGCVMSRLSASGPHRSSLWRRLRPRENAATLLRGARACCRPSALGGTVSGSCRIARGSPAGRRWRGPGRGAGEQCRADRGW